MIFNKSIVLLLLFISVCLIGQSNGSELSESLELVMDGQHLSANNDEDNYFYFGEAGSLGNECMVISSEALSEGTRSGSISVYSREVDRSETNITSGWVFANTLAYAGDPGDVRYGDNLILKGSTVVLTATDKIFTFKQKDAGSCEFELASSLDVSSWFQNKQLSYLVQVDFEEDQFLVMGFRLGETQIYVFRWDADANGWGSNPWVLSSGLGDSSSDVGFGFYFSVDNSRIVVSGTSYMGYLAHLFVFDEAQDDWTVHQIGLPSTYLEYAADNQGENLVALEGDTMIISVLEWGVIFTYALDPYGLEWVAKETLYPRLCANRTDELARLGGLTLRKNRFALRCLHVTTGASMIMIYARDDETSSWSPWLRTDNSANIEAENKVTLATIKIWNEYDYLVSQFGVNKSKSYVVTYHEAALLESLNESGQDASDGVNSTLIGIAAVGSSVVGILGTIYYLRKHASHKDMLPVRQVADHKGKKKHHQKNSI